MKITYTQIAIVGAVALAHWSAPLFAEALREQNKQFLGSYEKVRHALVADDLTGAKEAAKELGASGTALSQSKTLDEARAAFLRSSAEAEKLAVGQPGYYVMHCPMKKADWVQTTSKVENPYAGKEMLSCGEVKK